MELELVQFLQGIFSLILVVISVIVGLRIALKYFEHKKKELLLVGISWIGIVAAWIPDSITFLMIIFLDTPLNEEAYFIIGTAFLPVFVLCYVTAFTDLLNIKKRKLVLRIILILAVINEVIFFYLLLSPVEKVGTFLGPFQVEFNPLIDLFLIIWLLVVVIFGILFARHSMRAENPEIKLKGKFILAAFIFYLVGAILDVLIPLTPITVVITRLILTLGAISFYIGFILPEWIKKILLKEQ